VPLAFFSQWINAKFPEFVLYVQNIKININLGPLFHQGPWAAALKALALIWDCLLKQFCMIVKID